MKYKRQLAGFLSAKLKDEEINKENILSLLTEFEDRKIKKEVDYYFEETENIDKTTAIDLAKHILKKSERK